VKIVAVILSAFIIIGCSSSDMRLKEGNKIIQLICTIGHDTLDTFNNTFTRNYYEKASYTVDFSFSLDEQERIISEIKKMNFFDLPDELSHLEPILYLSKYQFCEIQLDGKNKKIVWVAGASYQDSDEYIRLMSVMNIIQEIIGNREEIKVLPSEVWY